MFQIVGLRELLAGIRGSRGKLSKAIEDQMRFLVEVISGRAAAKIIGSRASNPPEVLGVVTGRLRQAVAASGRVRRRGSEIVGSVGTNRVVYGPVHELGLTISVGRVGTIDMPQRPFLAPALEESRDLIADRLGLAFEAVLGTG